MDDAVGTLVAVDKEELRAKLKRVNQLRGSILMEAVAGRYTGRLYDELDVAQHDLEKAVRAFLNGDDN
jgi:hypothetical protein